MCIDSRAQIFESDGVVPEPPLPAFNHVNRDAQGQIVLIPASKYKMFAQAEEAAAGKGKLLGWAGKIIAYETGAKKVKVKIVKDASYEHLPVTGATRHML
jgi:hypothetical protein